MIKQVISLVLFAIIISLSHSSCSISDYFQEIQNLKELPKVEHDNNNNLKTCDNYSNIKQILALWGNAQPNLAGYSQKEAFKEIENYFNSK